MKKLFILSFLFCCIAVSFAQLNHQRCGTHELMLTKESRNPGYLNAVNNLFEQAKRVAEDSRNSRALGDTVYRIQVVFHVVHTTADGNIPDSVLINQIEVLNRDFRRRNYDTVQTRDVFKPVAADAGIEFYLATRDPDGNPTNGITRTAGTEPPFLGFTTWGDEIKSSATGGKNPWPTDRYLNIWVGNILLGFGVLGYAFPPDNAPNWTAQDGTDSAHQGVVLQYQAVGSNFSSPLDLSVAGGRSAVHEIGHYLGLRHIWGDGNCSQDDGIQDTPNAAAASQQTCDTLANTCVDTPVDFPDMIENYMDYSDDRCLNMFTLEQIGIMRAMIQIARPGIATIATETGIKRSEDNLVSVSLFPNPTSGMVELNVTEKNSSTFKYSIFDVMGQIIIKEQEVKGGYPQSIDLTTQPAGIYFVRINSGNHVLIKRFELIR